MGKLIGFELHKLFRKKSFYVCSGIVVLYVILTLLSMPDHFSGSFMFAILIGHGPVDSLIIILVSILICEDYKTGTLKTVVGRGYSRTAVYVSEFFTACCADVLLFAICWISTAACSLILHNEKLALDSEILSTMGAQLLLFIVIASVAFVASILSRKTSIGIVTGIVGITMVMLVLSLVDYWMKDAAIGLVDYWVPSLLAAVSTGVYEQDAVHQALLYGSIYTVALFCFGFAWFRKKDI